MARHGGPRRPAASGSRRPKRPEPRPAARGRPVPAVDTSGPPAAPFRLGIVPGVMPGKWLAAWGEQMPAHPLELHQLAVAEQGAALASGEVDAALVRLPVDDAALHVVRLYDEVTVVVASSDSHLTAADDLAIADLVDEIVIVPRDDVLHATLPGTRTPAFEAPASTADAIATVAAGVGVVVVPMSLARLHARKDVASRPLRDGPVSTVALAWRREADDDRTQALAGIVRGRTARSSR